MEDLPKVINQISIFPVFATALYAAVIYKKLGKELKTFSFFLFLSGFIQLTSSILWYRGENNLPLLHLYVAGGFTLLALFYKQVLTGFISPKIISTILILFLIFSLINVVWLQPLFAFNSYGLTVQSILIIILSLSSYIFLLNDIVKEARTGLAKSLNWINSGLFIYYTSNLLIFYFGNTLAEFSTEANRYVWILPSVFSMVMYTCFFIGLWHRPQN
jgi:hypothetical protein